MLSISLASVLSIFTNNTAYHFIQADSSDWLHNSTIFPNRSYDFSMYKRWKSLHSSVVIGSSWPLWLSFSNLALFCIQVGRLPGYHRYLSFVTSLNCSWKAVFKTDLAANLGVLYQKGSASPTSSCIPLMCTQKEIFSQPLFELTQIHIKCLQLFANPSSFSATYNHFIYKLPVHRMNSCSLWRPRISIH